MLLMGCKAWPSASISDQSLQYLNLIWHCMASAEYCMTVLRSDTWGYCQRENSTKRLSTSMLALLTRLRFVFDQELFRIRNITYLGSLKYFAFVFVCVIMIADIVPFPTMYHYHMMGIT